MPRPFGRPRRGEQSEPAKDKKPDQRHPVHREEHSAGEDSRHLVDQVLFAAQQTEFDIVRRQSELLDRHSGLQADRSPAAAIGIMKDKTSAKSLFPSFQSISSARLPSTPGQLTNPATIFTPSHPKYALNEFAGRVGTMAKIVTAVENRRSHIVIFGPRGMGKTSTTYIVAESLMNASYQVSRYSCTPDVTFSQIMRALLQNLVRLRPKQKEAQTTEVLAELLPQDPLSVDLVAGVLDLPQNQHAALIIDEFDRAADPNLKAQLADLIKTISDLSRNVTLIIVGVANTLEQLIGEHPSIQRQLVAIHLPTMSRDEILSIVEMGEAALGLTFDASTCDLIAALSRGQPYSAQLLCLHASECAIERNSKIIELRDLYGAIIQILGDFDPLTVSNYRSAVKDGKDKELAMLLTAMAFAGTDSHERTGTDDVAGSYRALFGSMYEKARVCSGLTALTSTGAPAMIEEVPTPAGTPGYVFVDPKMRLYILLKEAQRWPLFENLPLITHQSA